MTTLPSDDDLAHVRLGMGQDLDAMFVHNLLRTHNYLGGELEAGLRAEFEINRHLSVETSAGAQLRPGVRLNVRVDY